MVDTLRDDKVLLFTSADTGEGKSTVAANLAVSMAESGVDVVLVDCNLRRPKIHELFRSERVPGLVHVVAGTMELEEALCPSGTDRLRLLSAGRRSRRSAEILASSRMRSVIEEVSSMADLVILDGPAVRAGPDALALVLVADVVVFVSDALIGHTSAIAEARHRLDGVDAVLAAAIVNNSPETAGRVKHGRRIPSRSKAATS